MMSIDAKTIMVLLGGALVLYFVAKREVKAAAAAVGNAVNPVSDQNIFYQFAGAVTGAVTGSQDALGIQIFEWFNEE